MKDRDENTPQESGSMLWKQISKMNLDIKVKRRLKIE